MLGRSPRYHPRHRVGAAIIGGMDASKLMVLIFSAHANQSAQVRREVERAIGKGLIVLPFRIEDVNPAGAMEYALSNTHWLDGFTPPLERQFDRLANSVKALLANDRGEKSEPPDRAVISPVPTRPYGRLPIAGGLAVLIVAIVAIVAGSVAMFRDTTTPASVDAALVRAKNAPPVIEFPPRSDHDRIQGRWQSVEGHNETKAIDFDEPLGNAKIVWIIQGAQLTVILTFRGKEAALDRGLLSLSQGSERKQMDFAGRMKNGQAYETKGIYEFEGEFLKVCYSWATDPDKEPDFVRPRSFVIAPGLRRQYYTSHGVE
jgi:uncharacterized protein (TIGR03067 family)